ncbi:hypothetical protein RISK_005651 [Rhodopirellula islandica]|uniref:Transmembrane protein n=1 Tax=Rhodopirellula islandica TaxID=595434 RepID=A0A0J1B700_RHOIS|nr:hypothetical protein [Rhodopirellula islandica]KLU02585.1 hypothetical protein RISK_005651 [Rhodopirellula islandica]
MTTCDSASNSRHSLDHLPWLFSPAVDLATFGGSALVALAMLPIGAAFGFLHGETPGWTWVATILLIDVAHVYSTGFRVYFDGAELRRRPWLYGLTPVLAFAIGGAIYSESVTLFWSLLAYLAVFHFIRQQYGWVALYRSREHDAESVGWWIDASAIYLATLYPLIHWHAHLPRHFWWFAEGDFIRLPAVLATIALPLYWASMLAYAARSLHRGFRHGAWNPGKDIVVLTTAVCWYIGIITFNSDYAFTVTNVIIHGVPYMVLIYWFRWCRIAETSENTSGSEAGNVSAHPSGPTSRWQTNAGRVAMFLGVVWMLAYAEELLWDFGIWHERGWLFAWMPGGFADSAGETLAEASVWLAPALAVPQITHYVLDGFLWRRRQRASS